MKRFLKFILKPLLKISLFYFGTVGVCFAEEHEVNNIWWSVLDGFNGGSRPTCVAENYNDRAVDAVFDLFPTSFDFNGNPARGRAILTMRPHVTYKLYAWPEGSSNPHCALRSYSMHAR